MMVTHPALADTKTVKAGETWNVLADVRLDTLTIEMGGAVQSPGHLVTMISDGVETGIAPGRYENVAMIVTSKLAASPVGISSLPVGPSNRGLEDYRAAIYVNETGLVNKYSVTEAVLAGKYDEALADKVKITSTSDNFNGIMVSGNADYRIRNATFRFASKSDGSSACDFNGFGAVISAFKGARVQADNVDIYTEGVVRPAFFTHEHADVIVRDSVFNVMGGELYDEYVFNADTSIMTAPPWVLGLTGTARGTSLMGNSSTFTVVRTEANAANWGVLSTDIGDAMTMTVVDSTLTLTGKKDVFSTRFGSGYGTYVLPGEHFYYGTTFNVGTYATILVDGTAHYASSTFEAPLSIFHLDLIPTGETKMNIFGLEEEVKDMVRAEKPVFTGIQGQGRKTVINSDVFGWMVHDRGGNIIVTDGTIVNTGDTIFQFKAGKGNAVVSDGAELNSKTGVICQVMDNDDQLVGINRESSIGSQFNTEYTEKQGYPGLDYPVETPDTRNREPYTFTATDVALKGDLYNATGYFGGQSGDILTVTLGDGTTLEGVISAATMIHVDENGEQNTHFTQDAYYYIGHVKNKVYYNGGNDVAVNLEGNAVWTVTGPGVITGLNLTAGAILQSPAGLTLSMTVDGRPTDIQPGSYEGVIELTLN
jgi:hypothetical protein